MLVKKNMSKSIDGLRRYAVKCSTVVIMSCLHDVLLTVDLMCRWPLQLPSVVSWKRRTET